MKSVLRAFSYLRPYWVLELPALVCALGVTLTHLAFPWIVKILVDDVFVNRSVKALNFCMAAFAVTAVMSAAFAVARQWLFTFIGERAVADIRSDLFKHLQRLPLSFYSRERTGRVMSVFTNDVGAMQSLYTSTLVDLVTNTLQMLVTLAVMFKIDARLAAVSWPVLPLFAVSILAFGPSLRHSGSVVQERQANILEGLQEAISGAREIKSFGQERAQIRRFVELFFAIVGARLRQATLGGLSGGTTELVAMIGSAFVVWWGGHAVIAGEMTPGVLVAFTSYLGNLFGPTAWFVQLNVTLQAALAGADRVFALLDTEPSIQDRPDAVELRDVRGEISFRNVSFHYTKGKPVLRNVTFTARPGEMVALVGPSGAGKTTLVSLIPRFYDPTEGAVTIDGIDLRNVTQESLRRHIAVVFQDTFLFGTTIRENIRFGRSDASDAEVEEAAKAANAHRFIMDLPDGYETQVGERGVRLSGGQKQRIAIARAILRNPRVLILDEATSSLDSESEAAVQDALERLMQGRTCIVIAHRLSTVLKADKILVLEDGRPVEIGTHSRLLANGGPYRRLYDAQFARPTGSNGSMVDLGLAPTSGSEA
ncbi:MAG: ABC transporter ATP-binding protein [Armatimonadota bacterium]